MSKDPSRKEERDENAAIARKPFTDPHLVTYGDIRQITNAIGLVGAMDMGGSGMMTKTR